MLVPVLREGIERRVRCQEKGEGGGGETEPSAAECPVMQSKSLPLFDAISTPRAGGIGDGQNRVQDDIPGEPVF